MRITNLLRAFLSTLTAVALLISTAAFADTYRTLPGTSMAGVWDVTTGSLYSLGVNGVGPAQTIIPNAATANAWSGLNNFTGTFQIGGTTQTFPTSGLIVGTTDAQTLSNKTMTSPVLNNPIQRGPAPIACGSTCTTVAGNTYLLNQAAGSVASLPTSAGTGSIVTMIVTVATTSAAEKVLLTTTADAIIGTAIGENAGTAKIFVGNASTYHSIQMPFAGSQPSGGFIGDQIVCKDIIAGTWACNITYQGGATPTTPYSASTT